MKKTLTKANKKFLNSKTNPRKKIKSFFPKNFKEDILEDQNNILINKMKLYNDRNKVIKLFEGKNFKLRDYSLNAKSEPEEFEEFETKFEESIEERTKNIANCC